MIVYGKAPKSPVSEAILVGEGKILSRIFVQPGEQFRFRPRLRGWRPSLAQKGNFVVFRDTRGFNLLVPLPPFFPNGRIFSGNQMPLRDPASGEVSSMPKPGEMNFIFLLEFAKKSKFLPSVEVVVQDFDSHSEEKRFRLFNDGSAIDQEDEDGSSWYSGDLIPNDGIYTRTIKGMPPGKYRYRFLINNGHEVMSDPFSVQTNEGWSVVKVN